MSEPLIDFDLLYNLASNDKNYIFEVVSLYLNTMPSGLEKLEHSIRNDAEFEVIQKEAHFLKSSASVVKVREMYDNLIGIEMLARQRTGRDEMVTRLDNILATFKEAYPKIVAERDKCNPSKKRSAKK